MCTPGLGIEYEVHIPAYFALKLNARKDIEDFTLQSNLPCFGKLDDLFVDVKMKNGRKHYFAFQLKHRDPKKQKKLLPTNFTASGDFNLKQYCDSFISLNKRKRRYNFILYSNIYLDHSRINEVSDFRMISMRHKRHFLNASFFDESTDCNGVYKFVAKKNTGQEFKQFFPKLSLLVRQQDERSVANCIIKIFTDEYGVDEQIAVNYINVFRKWHKNEYTNQKFNKKMLNLLLCDLLLSPFIITIPQIVTDEKIELLQSSIRQFDVNVVEDSKQNFIEEMSKNQTAPTWVYTPEADQLLKRSMKKFKIKDYNNDKCLLCLAKDMKLVDKFATELSPQDKTKFLNFLLKVPLTVEFNQSSELLIYKLRESYPQLQLVLVGLGVDRKRFSQVRIFSNLDDLCAIDRNLFLKIVSKYKITIQDRDAITLEELIVCDADFRKAIGLMQLYQMALGNFSISDKAEKLPKTYIPRTLSLTYLAVGRVLEYISRTNDLLIIRRCDNFNQIINQITLKGMNVVTIEQFDDDHSHEIVIFDNEACSKKVYDEICTKTRRSVFVVEVVDAKSFLLIMSSGTSELKQLTLPEKSVNEDNICTHFDYPTNFVCAQPGMGKSTLFNYLKSICPSRYWTVFVDLKEHSEFFKGNPSSTQIVARFLNDDVDEDSFCNKKLKKLFVEKKLVCFFFDGLDELEYNSVDNVLDSVNKLTSTGYRVWLSSRENLLKKIEDKLNIFPIRINEFTKEQQEDYIRKRLQDKYNEEEIVVILEKIFTSNNVVKNCRILGVPLQLYILTEIFQEDGQLHEDIFLLTKLYQIYFQGRHRHLLNKLRSSSSHLISGVFLTSTLVQYEIPAIRSCLGNEMHMVLPESNEFLEEIKQKGDPFGIITKFDDAGKPVFDHETYAEFFACKWLSKNLDKVRMLGTCLFHIKYQNLRLILDIMLAEDSPLHLAVIYKDMGQFERHREQEVPKDKGGRTPLHLACCHGIRHPELESNKTWCRYDNDDIDPEELAVSKEITKYLISKYDAEEEDKLFGFDPFDYAVASQCLAAVEMILDKHYVLIGLHDEVPQNEYHLLMKKIVEKLKDIYDDKVKEITITYYSSKFGYENLMHVIINAHRINFTVNPPTPRTRFVEILNIENRIFKTLSNESLSLSLHLAVRGNNRYIVNQLIREEVDINVINLNYETPLHVAVKTKNLEMIDVLLAHGASVNTSPLITPILKSASPEICNLLVRKGADINSCSYDKRTLLHYVAEEGNTAIIDLLVDKGLDINATDEAGRTPLHLAAAEGQFHVIKKLLEKGANINATTKKKRTALHYAVIKGNKETVQLLIDENININAQDATGSTALHLAVEFHCFEITRLLLDNNASPDIITDWGESVLHYAAIGGNINVIRLLLARRVSLNAINRKKESALHLAALNRHYAATALLIQNGACLNNTTHKQRTTLHYAAKGGNVEIVKLMLQKGLDPNAKDRDGISALHLAIKFKRLCAVKCLIENGADINASSNFGEMSLHFACVHGIVDFIEVLLTNGAEINAGNENGETPLHIAVRSRHFQTIDVLLAKYADVRVRTNRSETPLHYAAEQGITEIVELLLDRGADINVVDVDGQAPLHLAIKDGYLNVTKLLIDRGADANICTVSEQTTLHYASARGHLEIVQLLPEKQASVNASDVNGVTALHLSAKSGIHRITSLLVAIGADVKAITKKNETALHYAIKGGSLETIKLLARCIPVNARNEEGVTALHLAFERNSYDVVKLLLDQGADTEAVTRNGETMMHFVARTRSRVLLNQMVQRGAQVNAKDNNGSTPLHVAVENCNLWAAKNLLGEGADLNARNGNGVTPLEIARELRESQLIDLLETFGTDGN